MEYNKIIAVTGLPGLYELLSSKSDGAIVRSLDDKSTKFVSSRIHNFSHLESIEIYTTRENVNLLDVLKAMEGSNEKLPDEKDNAALKGYFEKVYPELDFDRVYTSDLKKMVKWFHVLKNNQIELKISETAPEETETVSGGETTDGKTAADTEDKKPAKKPVAKKQAESTEEPLKGSKAAAAEKPAEKAAAKTSAKAPATEKAAPAKKAAEKTAEKTEKTAKSEKAEKAVKAAKTGKASGDAEEKPKKATPRKKKDE